MFYFFALIFFFKFKLKVNNVKIISKIRQKIIVNFCCVWKKSRIRETKHLSTDADSSTDTTVGWTKNTQKPKFFLKTDKIMQNAKTQKPLEICQYQQYTLRPEVSNPSGSVVSTMFCKEKSAKKQKKKIARRFQTTSKQKCSNVRPLLSITFPQGFRISKNIGHPTSGNGGKKTVKRYLKSEQTDTQTDGRTFRLIESIGPEGRCFENRSLITTGYPSNDLI